MAEKIMEIQQQVKHNADELQDFIMDLGSWQKEMEAKDKQLKMSKKSTLNDFQASSSSDVQTSDSTLRAKKMIEITDPTKSKKKIQIIDENDDKSSKNKIDSYKTSGSKSSSREETNKVTGSTPPTKKIKSYDYAAWEKFDVDKALEELEGNLEESETDEDSADEEFLLIQQAVVEKDKGNEFFKKGDFVNAIDCYTKGIQCDPANPILPANRAMALLKTGQVAAAEVDCTLAISLDPTYVKAYHRRANARAQLKRVEEARQDFVKVIELEPTNKIAKLELQKLTELAKNSKNDAVTPSNKSTSKPAVKSSSKPVEKLSDSGSFQKNLMTSFAKSNAEALSTKSKISKDVEEIFDVDKKPHQRSKKPLHRIEIVDVDGEDDLVPTSNFISRKDSNKIELFESLGESEIKISAMPISTNTESKKGAEKIKIVSSSTQENLDKDAISKSFDEKPQKKNVSCLQARVEEEIMQTMSNNLSIVDEKNSIVFSKAPNSSVQFLSEWKTLQNVDSRIEYLRLLSNPVKDYIRIFKHSMDAYVFNEIIDSLTSDKRFESQELSMHLLGMSKVPRMSALVMFLSSVEKSRLDKVVEKVLEISTLSQSEKKEIKNVFS